MLVELLIKPDSLVIKDMSRFRDSVMHKATCVVTCKEDTEFKKEYDIIHYIHNEREDKHVLLEIPKTDLLDYDTLYNLEFNFNEKTQTVNYLDSSRIFKRVLELTKEIDLKLDSQLGVQRVVHKSKLSESNTNIVLTAASLINGVTIGIQFKEYDQALELLHKTKNILELWQTDN